MTRSYDLSPLISVSGLLLFLPLLHPRDVMGAFLFLKGGRKNFFEKSKFGSFKSKKISRLVSEGENLTNLENRIDIQQVHY